MSGAGVSGAFLTAYKSLAINLFIRGVQAYRQVAEDNIEAFDPGTVRGLSATAEIDRPQSNYGVILPLIYGLARVDTNLIWASAYRRETITQTVVVDTRDPDYLFTTYPNVQAIEVPVQRDYVDFAVVVGAGPIGGYRRLWFNHTLVYDADRWGDSRPFYNGQQLNVEFYLGTEDQPPSPTIEASEGVGATPAYRGRAYLVFKNVDITQLGGVIPVIQAEVVGIFGGYQALGFSDYTPSQTLVDETEVINDDPITITRRTVVDEFIREDGNIWPLPFASINFTVHGFRVLNDVLVRAGVPQSLVDVSQLGARLTGIALTEAGPIRPFVEALVRHANGVFSESDGLLRWLVNPRLPSSPIYAQNCLISEIGLTVNSLHDVDGRDGYFSSSGGTSEGQFVSIWACCRAYQATGQQAWLDRGLFLAAALEPYLYNRSIPATPELFIPHWLYNVKRPIQAESSILALSAKAVDMGSYLEAVVPLTEWPEQIKRIDRAYRKSAALIWENREADLVNFSYLGVKRTRKITEKIVEEYGGGFFNIKQRTVGTNYYTAEGFSKKAQLTEAELTIVDSFYDPARGYVVRTQLPSDYDSSVDDEIVIAYTLVGFGEVINVGDRYEAWPNWRKLARGEIDAAGDSLYWAADAYALLHEITGDGQWLDAYNANKLTLIESHDVDDGRQIFKRQIANSPYNYPGTFSRSERDGFGHNSWRRRARDGVIYASIPAGRGEVAIGRGVDDWWRSDSDTMLVTAMRRYHGDLWQYPSPFLYINNEPVYVWIDTDLVYSEQTRFYAKWPEYSFNGTVTAGAIETYQFNRTDFKSIFDFLNPDAVLPSGAPIKAVGISVFNSPEYDNYPGNSGIDNGMDLEIHLVRPMPEIALPYTPYAPMYTVNVLNNDLVDWRGVPGMGYCYPHVWHAVGIDAGMAVQLDFLRTAQLQYQAHFGAPALGPFIPAFYWDRADARQYGSANTWGWNWVDPNSQWGGYQYRALQSVARAVWETAHADAVAICEDYLAWLNGVWMTSAQFPPTDFPEEIPIWQPNTEFVSGFYNAVIDIARPVVANGFVYKPMNTGESGAVEPAWPTTLYARVMDGGIEWECSGYLYDHAYGNYNEPHMCALILRAAIYCHLGGVATADAEALIVRCYDYLAANFVGSGELSGSWSQNGEWWMFWHAEIVGTLSILLTDGAAILSALSLDQATIENWLSLSNDFIERFTRS